MPQAEDKQLPAPKLGSRQNIEVGLKWALRPPHPDHVANNGDPAYTDMEGIDTLLEAMGLMKSLKHKTSTLVWPRSIVSRNGDRRKKRRLENLTVELPDTINTPSARFITNAMGDIEKNHHRQSETFGGGMFNDPLVVGSAENSKIQCNWNGLVEAPAHRQEALAMLLTTKVFMQLHDSLGIKALEDQLQSGNVRPCNFEQGMFQEEAVVRYKNHKNEMVDLDTYMADNADVASINRAMAEADYIRLIGNNCQAHPMNADLERIIDDFSQNGTTNAMINHANALAPHANVSTWASNALLYYIMILKTWRMQCFGDAISHMLSTGSTRLVSTRANASHTHFFKLKKGLWTSCLAACSNFSMYVGQQVRTANTLPFNNANTLFAAIGGGAPNIWTAGPAANGLLQELFQSFRNNTEEAKITTNVLLYMNGPNAMIKQPNLHINRCTSLQSSDQANSASSIDEKTWIVQELAGMMPLTGTMAETLLKQAPNMHDSSTQGLRTHSNKFDALKRQYAKFLHGKDEVHVPGGSGHEMNTFLMHWFMSEFHPTPWVREAARKASGDLNGQESDRVNHFMNAMANAIEENTTFTDGLKKACEDLAPTKYDAQSANTYFSVAPATSKYECVMDFTGDGHLHCKSEPWFNVPADGKLSAKILSDNQELSNVANIDMLPESVHKTFLKAGVKYHMSNMGAHAHNFALDRGLGLDPARTVNPSQINVEHFDAESGTVKKVHTGDNQVVLSNPWTGLVPYGIHTLSSLAFPIDLQYRDEESNPEHAGINVYKKGDSHMKHAADAAAHYCRDYPHEAMRHVLMILFSRFYKPAGRFMNNGQGVPVYVSDHKYAMSGCHFSHGPYLPEVSDSGAGEPGYAQDIVILRPNIEHEMLGIIMGRGGTQELGATFWGQTELSCYDDAQHGKYQSNLCMSCLTLSMLLIYCVMNRYLGHELQVSFE